MKTIIKIELDRALKNHKFLIALFIGCIISVMQVIFVVIPLSNSLDEYLQYGKGLYYPGWLFSSWLSADLYNQYSYLFYLILPVLSSFAYATSGFEDYKSGFIKNICIRINKKKYYFSKFIAVFISGGLTIAIPLLLNLLLSSLFLPSMVPEATASLSSIRSLTMWHTIYYSHPYIHSLLFIILNFIFAGAIATFSLVVGKDIEHKIVVLLSPFLIFIFINVLSDVINYPYLSPINFLRSGYGMTNGIVVIIEISLILLFNWSIYVLVGEKDDVL